MKKQEQINSLLEEIGVVAVVQTSLPAMAVQTAKKLLNKGVKAMEIAYRDLNNFDASDECIRAIREQVPEMLVGGATITSPELAKRAYKAGAQFVFSAGFNPKTVSWCVKHNFPIIPGVVTPGEIEQALGFNLSLLKLFPVSVLGGVDYLKALKGPYPQVKFLVSGGVNENNVELYRSCSNVKVVSGSWLSNNL
ncbi:MAG: bifunctional 4-hydroxy-2-oxoglutarate aldolase/2-dehydro-3-deoxy-phosphogluconate aldolase [Treponema sp.]|nr:bifunctional 4-hydroxy-2-oxoglutarate aldolase/2-dehydro-3-deoxy-phosphogluconate aldolase [Treponema sp.]